MIDQFNHYFQIATEFTKANPAAAGVMSLWGAGLIALIFKGIPSKIYNWIKRQSTTSLALSNENVGGNQAVFNNFVAWLNNSKWSKFSRSVKIDAAGSMWGGGSVVLGIGEGTHVFVFKKRLFFAFRGKITGQSGQSQVFHEITVTMLGRNRKIIEDLYNTFNPPPENDKLVVYQFDTSSKYWAHLASAQTRSLESVVVANGVMEALVKKIDWHRANKEWYKVRGLPYKLVIILHGPPGTGKTSIVKALASHYKSNVALFNLELQASVIRTAFAKVPNNSFILCEDFDDCRAIHRRADDTSSAKSFNIGKGEDGKQDILISSMSEILNAFDGVVPLEDSIIFLTTNHLEKIDPAFIRPGRVDSIYEIGELQSEDIKRYVKLMFPGTEVGQGVVFKPAVGCKIQAAYFENKESVDDFITALEKDANHANLSVKETTHVPHTIEEDLCMPL